MKRLRLKALGATAVLGVLVAGLLVGGRATAETQPEAAVGSKRLPADALDVKVIEREGDRAILMIRNRTPFLVTVYVRGVRSGWLRGYGTAVIRGLPVGYHSVYAHSRWGSVSWGPRQLWIPSRWTLYR